MSNFDFDKLNELIESNNFEKKVDNKQILVNECQHKNIKAEGISNICTDCGVILSKDFSYEREWRYYGLVDTKHNNDPNRCSIRKSDEKNIEKDVEKFGINAKIIEKADELYNIVTENKIYRGNTRKGIIYACVYHAYLLNNTPKSNEELITIFDINQKIALNGLKFVNLNLPSDSKCRNYEINTKHLISEIMDNFNATTFQKNQVISLYTKLENRSSLLNRSRPQSVACGIVRFYILKVNPTVSLDYFKQKCKLSDLTLSRIVKEIEKIVLKLQININEL
tara:strand:+ start:1730 stop:2572 length:843 start_codon:yes stop_codon:yes gene_type:complete